MKNWFYSFLFLFGLSSMLHSQSSNDLTFYCDVMINADDPDHRIYAQNKFNRLFKEALDDEGSYENDFSNLKWISQLNDTIYGFRIFSWELKKANNEYAHFGVIQMKDGTCYTLSNERTDLVDLDYMDVGPESWYGALYYAMYPFESNGERAFLLCGYNAYSEFNKVKFADVLHFVDGKPVFGKSIFKTSDEGTRRDIKSRLILQYSSDAAVTLRFNEGLNMLVHDHLITRMGRMPGQGPTNLPDGSYVGWKLNNGQWVYVEKIYDQVSEEAPRPKPVLDKRTKGVFGKGK